MCYKKWPGLYYILCSFLNTLQPCWRAVKQKATNNSKIPLKWRRFLPEVNMARNSHLGSLSSLAQGTNNACSSNGNYLISSKCSSREGWVDAQTMNITTFFLKNWTMEGLWDCDEQRHPEEQTEGVKIGMQGVRTLIQQAIFHSKERIACWALGESHFRRCCILNKQPHLFSIWPWMYSGMDCTCLVNINHVIPISNTKLFFLALI